MDQFTMVSKKMDQGKDQVKTFMLMEVFMMVNGMKIENMAEVYINTLIIQNILGNGRLIAEKE